MSDSNIESGTDPNAAQTEDPIRCQQKQVFRAGVWIAGFGFVLALAAAVVLGRGDTALAETAEVAHAISKALMLIGAVAVFLSFQLPKLQRLPAQGTPSVLGTPGTRVRGVRIAGILALMIWLTGVLVTYAAVVFLASAFTVGVALILISAGLASTFTSLAVYGHRTLKAYCVGAMVPSIIAVVAVSMILTGNMGYSRFPDPLLMVSDLGRRGLVVVPTYWIVSFACGWIGVVCAWLVRGEEVDS